MRVLIVEDDAELQLGSVLEGWTGAGSGDILRAEYETLPIFRA